MTTENTNHNPTPADALTLALAEHLKQQTRASRAWVWIIGAVLLLASLTGGGIASFNYGFIEGMKAGWRSCNHEIKMRTA